MLFWVLHTSRSKAILSPTSIRPRVILGHTPNRTQYPIRSCTRQDLGPNWALGHGEVGGTTQSCWVLVMRPNVVRSWWGGRQSPLLLNPSCWVVVGGRLLFLLLLWILHPVETNTQMGPTPAGPNAILGLAHFRIQSNFRSCISITQSYCGSCTWQDPTPTWGLHQARGPKVILSPAHVRNQSNCGSCTRQDP